MAKRKPKPPMAACDDLFGKIIRAQGWCEECGSTDVIQCAHGFSRRYLPVRCDTRNAFALCRKCHHHYTNHPLEWDEWLRAKWGAEQYGELREKALHGGRVDWKAMRERLRQIHARVCA